MRLLNMNKKIAVLEKTVSQPKPQSPVQAAEADDGEMTIQHMAELKKKIEE